MPNFSQQPSINQFSETFRQLLDSYYQQQQEEVLFEFYELGKQMNQQGLAPEKAVELFATATEDLVKRDYPLSQAQRLVPLIELIMAYGVSFRQRLDWQQQQSDIQFYRVLEQSSDLVVICSYTRQISYANPAYKTLVGNTNSLHTLPTFIDPESGHAVKPIWSQLRQGKDWHGRVQLELTPQKRHHIRLRCFPLVREFDQPTHFVFLAEDIQQKVELQQQMQQIQRLASLGEVASNISHEFNNILLIISGFAELISDEPEVGRQQEFAQEILQAVAKGSSVIKQILALASESQQTASLHDLQPLITDISSMLTTLVAGEERLSISSSPELADYQIQVSDEHLCQILTNLVINASHAIEHLAEAGRVSVSFRLVPQTQKLQLCVSDNGCGIPEQQQQHIFEPFYSTKKVGKGSGLGLSIVLKLVDSYGGSIRLQSKPGGGTQFYIDFTVINKQNSKH